MPTQFASSPTHNEPSGQGYVGHRSMKTVNGRGVNRRKTRSRRVGQSESVSGTAGSTGGGVDGAALRSP